MLEQNNLPRSETRVAPPGAAKPAATGVTEDKVAARRRAILSGPILGTIWRIALPTLGVLFAQTMVGVAETGFVGLLGTDALAGAALVLPVLLLMVAVANLGLGGGVGSAVARALGRGDTPRANAVVLNALALACAFGALCTVLNFYFGPAAYAALGGHGATLKAAVSYSNIVFGGAVFFCCLSVLAAALRGTGNTLSPAIAIGGSALIFLPLSPLLILGFGPVPRLGMWGAGAAMVGYNALACALLIGHLRSGKSALRLSFVPRSLDWNCVREISGVGGASAFGVLQSQLIPVLILAVVGTYGTKAVAAYSLGVRLELLLSPVPVAIGLATLSMVGMNVGAGQPARAYRIVWLAAILAASITGAIGSFFALVPDAWLTVFTRDPEVLAIGRKYMTTVSPMLAMYSFGTVVFFGCQGAGRVAWAVGGITLRLGYLAAGCWLLIVHYGAAIDSIFWLIGTSFLFMAIVYALILLSGGLGLRPGTERESKQPTAAKT